MKFLVTGGAGFIGSNIVKILLERGHQVTVLDNFSSGYRENLLPFNGKIRLIEGDIRNKETVFNALEGQESVLHLAASVGNKKSIENPFYDSEHNVFGVLNVLEGMRHHRIKKIVFSSSAGIFGEPQYMPVDEKHPCEPDSPYGCSKLAGEKLILSYMKLYGLKSVCLRYFNVYGENQRFDAYGNVIPIFVARALKGEPIVIYGDGEQTRDFIHVRDIAMINVLAAENFETTGVFNLGTGSAITINQLAKSVREIVGNLNIKIEHQQPRPGDVRHCTANIERLIKNIGLKPSTDVQGLLKNYIEWMRNDKVKK